LAHAATPQQKKTHPPRRHGDTEKIKSNCEQLSQEVLNREHAQNQAKKGNALQAHPFAL